jgi:hypothetical protein
LDLRVNNDQAPKSARESGNVSDGARRSQFKAEATNAKLTATENEARKEKERSKFVSLTFLLLSFLC